MTCSLARPAPLALAVALALGAAGPSFAQTGAATAATVAVPFNLAAQPLAQALNEWARQTRVQLVVSQSLVTGRQAPAVTGSLTARQALDRLLAGSGLYGRFDGNLVTIEQASPNGATLGTVTVTAVADLGGTTQGTGSYTETGSTTSATGLALSLRETPQSVSVVTRQQIQDQGYTTVKEALDSVTGVYGNAWDTKRTYYYSRGFNIDRFSFDGVVSNDDSGGMYGENAQDLAFYDRVEVVRGANGLLTGAGEPSATVNYLRKRADSKTFEGEAELSLGSWKNRRGTVDLSTPVTEDGRVRARLVAVAQDKESSLDFYDNTRRGIYGTVEADLTPQTKLSVGADYMREKIDGATWGGLPVMFSDGTLTNWSRSMNEGASWPYWNSTIKSVFADVEHTFDNGWSLKGNLTQRKKDYQSKLVLPYDLAGTGLDSETGSGLSAYSWAADGEHTQTTASLQASGPFSLLGRQHELMIGYNGNRRHSSTSGSKYAIEDIANYYNWDGSYAEPEWTDTDNDSPTSTRQNALYAATRLSLADPLKLIVGGRFTDWQSTANGMTSKASEFTPYSGLVYDIDRFHSLYASYTEIFNPQNKRDSSGNFLDPTSGKNYELGLKGEYFDGRLNASVAIFKTKQDNVATADGNNMIGGEQVYISTDGVRSRGIEAEVSGDPLPGWNVTAGISRTLSKNADGSTFNPYMPRTMFKLATSYRLPGAFNKLTLGGNMVWQNGTYDDFSFTSASTGDTTTYRYHQSPFGVVGVMARYEFTPKLALQVNVNNLFDKKYWAYYDSNSGTYGTPRNFLATLSYKF